MKSTAYKTITAIIGILGAIGGIFTANMFGTFNFALLIGSWISAALICLIFFGIASILEYLEQLGAGSSDIEEENDDTTEMKNDGETWECPQCHQKNPLDGSAECPVCHWRP